MSLKLWLPFNGKTDNQGIADCLANFSSVETVTGGKIGNCAHLTKSYALLNPEEWDYTNKSVSFGAWLKFSKTELVEFAESLSDRLTSTNCRLVTNILGYANYCGLALMCKTNDIYTDGSLNYIYFNFTIRKDTSSSAYGITGQSISFDTWTHVFCVRDYSKQELRLYINGNLARTTSISSLGFTSDNTNYFGLNVAGIDSGNGVSASLPFYINDLRVYDEALSPKEIREISKGLVVHFPMNQPERSRNYIRGYYGEQEIVLNDYNNGAASFTQFTSILTKSMSTFSGKKITVSFDVKSPNGDTEVRVYNSNRNSRYRLYNEDKSSNDIKLKNVRQSWVRFVGKFNVVDLGEDYDDSASNKIEVFAPNQPGVTIKNFKMEAGWNDNPVWTPAPEDAYIWNDLIEYDISGNENDAIMTSDSEPIWSADSPRNLGCYEFDTNTKYMYFDLDVTGFSDSYTFSWWGYTVDWTQNNGKMFWGFKNGNRFNYWRGIYCNTGDGYSNPYLNSSGEEITPPSVETWRHYAIVGNGTNVRLFVDGILYGTAKTYRSISGSVIVINGWFTDTSTYYRDIGGKMSDFRIYSTALSEADILELYKAPISIANNGALITQSEVIE